MLTLLKPKMHFGLTPTYPTGAISVMIPTRHLCLEHQQQSQKGMKLHYEIGLILGDHYLVHDRNYTRVTCKHVHPFQGFRRWRIQLAEERKVTGTTA